MKKITGTQLRETLKLWKTRLETAASQFNSSLTAYPHQTGLPNKDPKQVVTRFLQAEAAIAQLQTEQMRYNLAVRVSVLGKEITLAEAIKRVGGLGRAEKMWRSASSEKQDRYSYTEESRDTGKLYADRTISLEDAGALSIQVGREASAYRVAISNGNATEIETNLSPELFE